MEQGLGSYTHSNWIFDTTSLFLIVILIVQTLSWVLLAPQTPDTRVMVSSRSQFGDLEREIGNADATMFRFQTNVVAEVSQSMSERVQHSVRGVVAYGREATLRWTFELRPADSHLSRCSRTSSDSSTITLSSQAVWPNPRYASLESLDPTAGRSSPLEARKGGNTERGHRPGSALHPTQTSTAIL